jgi:hypothetical protein
VHSANHLKSIHQKKLVPIMATPNIGAPSQNARKTRSILREPHKTAEAEQEMDQIEGIVDVNAISSLQDAPMSATLVEEETKALMMTVMEVDSHNSAQGHQTSDVRNL